MYQRVIKRGLDILLCGAAMLIIWPLFLLIAILIKLDSKGPVYFKQKRVGIHKTHFYIYKFRTMRTDTPRPRCIYYKNGEIFKKNKFR